MQNHLMLAWVVFVASVGGCLDSDSPDFGGVGFTMVSHHPTEFYVKVYSNEYPEPDPGIARPFRSRNNTVFHCADGDQEYRERGNYLDAIYLKIVLYELRETDVGPQPGEKLDEKRWDGLECFEAYTFVLDEHREMMLYYCRSCETPEERAGLDPWPPSQDG